MLKGLKQTVSALWRAVRPVRLVRMYQAARPSRLVGNWGNATTSADSELVSSLGNLRNRSRALVRDAAYAKRAKVVVQNNVIGAGIGMQAQVMSTRDAPRDDVNDAIEEAWRRWCYAQHCHTGGTLCFADLERTLMGQIFEAGEVFVRKHYRAFGGSAVPFALELIESERIVDEITHPIQPPSVPEGVIIKMGIEQDRYGRPIAYWVRERHPGETRWVRGETDKMERIPADQIMHLRMVDRWPQTRGEPWLHAVARKLNDMDAYTEAEITAARGAACYMGAIETADDDTSPLVTPRPDGTQEFDMEAGTFKRLASGEKLSFFSPNRPNSALDPFMRYMLREISAGTGPSYESVSRDYSQSNFSASQIAVHEDRDLWRIIQQAFIRMFRLPLHAEWLRQAVLAGTIAPIRLEEYATNPSKFEAVSFKPRGGGWIQPRTDVPAFIEAVKAGFMPLGDVIAMTCNGKDFWDVMKEIQHERKVMKMLGLQFTTSPEVFVQEEKPAPAPAPKQDDTPPGDDEDDDENRNDPPRRVVSLRG